MRGAAALYVFQNHFPAFGLIAVPLYERYPILEFGWSGVSFFFVLSGYLLATLYTSVNARYFVRRVFRTFPLYYLTLPLFAVAGIIVVSPAWFAYAETFVSSTFAFHDYPQWTLCLEEMFYFLLLPLLLKLRSVLGKDWRKVFVGLTVEAGFMSYLWGAFVCPAVSVKLLSVPLLTRLVVLEQQMPYFFVCYMIGVTISGLELSRDARKTAALCGALLFVVAAFWFGPAYGVEGPTVSGLAYGLIILGFRDSRVFTNKVMMLLGKWSYGIYLFQVPLLALFKVWGIPLTIAVSAASFYLFETPMMKLGDLIARVRLSPKRPRPEPRPELLPEG